MNKTNLLWLIAFFVTVFAAYYQRVTGPSYPLMGIVHLKNADVRYSLPRSHGSLSSVNIQVQAPDSTFRGFVEWKKYKTLDPWTRSVMNYRNGTLTAELPNQPPAGKLEYRLTVSNDIQVAVIPADEPVVIRFKGDVPLSILIPHILAMFATMLLAARAGLEYFNGQSNLKILTKWTIGFVLVGGFLFGPIVQYYAFNAWWTGWPLGTDLTDNKTAIVLVAWIAVMFSLKKSKNPKAWALTASIITFAVFLIPHSLFGSELNYNDVDRRDIKIDTVRTR